MLDLKELNKVDPLLRNAEKSMTEEAYSPMDPPEALTPPSSEEIGYDEMHPFLQSLMDEHASFSKALDAFEVILTELVEDGMTRERHAGITEFFRRYDEDIIAHNQLEEKRLFPLLQKRLLASGEHSNGPDAHTSVDMLEDDHAKFMQLAAITFSFFGLAGRLPDSASAAITLDAAMHQAKALVELLRIHIFREDNVVFPAAQRHITSEEFGAMNEG